MSTPIQEITSRQNERIKTLAKLRQRKERERQGLFIIEGAMEIRRLLASGRGVQAFYFCEDYVRDAASCAFLEQVQNSAQEVFRLSPSVFDKVCYREGADGFLAVAQVWDLSLEALELSENPLLVVAESIEKPGNLGSLIRSAEAAGADALIVCDPVTDVFNPNVVRASRGLVCSRQISLASSQEVAAFLKQRGIRSVALMPETDTLHWSVDWTQAAAIVAGSEWAGLSAFWETHADVRVRLPMCGTGDSLNVSVATAITLYEALRQRS